MSQPNAIEWIRYSFPTPGHPCYQLIAAVRVDAARDWKVKEVRVDGRRVRDFWVYNEGEYHKLNLNHNNHKCKDKHNPNYHHLRVNNRKYRSFHLRSQHARNVIML